MTKAYVKTRETILRTRGSVVRMVQDENGVVSFEYLIVAACIIAAVGVAFGTGGTTGIGAALTTGITTITASFTKTIGA